MHRFEVLFWVQHFALILGVSSLRWWTSQMKQCDRVAPVIRTGTRVIIFVVWVQYMFAILIIPWTKARLKRRARAAVSSVDAVDVDTPHYGTDSEGRPLRPAYVSVVAYVPSLEAWKDVALPYPAREIPPNTDPDTTPSNPNTTDTDGGESGTKRAPSVMSVINLVAPAAAPECPICYGDFLEPYRAIMAGKPGTWCADPLWALQCGHVFHEHCCAEWFAMALASPTCPYCTQPADPATARATAATA